jgi:hypothetical protein
VVDDLRALVGGAAAVGQKARQESKAKFTPEAVAHAPAKSSKPRRESKPAPQSLRGGEHAAVGAKSSRPEDVIPLDDKEIAKF